MADSTNSKSETATPTMRVISSKPATASSFIQTDSNTAADRAQRRLMNVRGTLGAGVNLDGTLSTRPPYEPPTKSNYVGESNFYFGTQTAPVHTTFRHGPGLSAVIFSDSQSNLEKKKYLQRELAEYEKIQRKEREEMKKLTKLKDMEEHCKQWPFGNNQSKGYVPKFMQNKVKTPEKSQPHVQLNVLGLEDKNSVSLETHVANKSRRVKSKEPASDVPRNPINHLPIPHRQSNPMRKSRLSVIEDDSKHIHPLTPRGGTPITNSLPIGGNHPVITADSRLPRRKTDVVRRRGAGPDNNIHDPSKDDPNEPAYFHFGRPGAGAPLFNAITKKGTDPKLLSYKRDAKMEKIRISVDPENLLQ